MVDSTEELKTKLQQAISRFQKTIETAQKTAKEIESEREVTGVTRRE